MKRILVIQTAFLGDVILATPVVAELKKKFPEAVIDVLVKKGNESLLANNSKISNVLIFDKSKGKYKSILRLIKEFRASNYDLVVNLHRFGSSGLLAGLSKGKIIIGFKKNPFSFLYHIKKDHIIGNGTHEVSRNLSLISQYTNEHLIRPELIPSKTDYEKTASLNVQDYYCLAPASVWFTKQLPESKWVELTKNLSEFGSVYFIGAPGDYELCERIKKAADISNSNNLCGELSLLESASLMHRAKRNYVNDSGPLHIASAMNAPVTSFFCSTIRGFGFGPLSDDSQVVEVSDLECRPCGLHGHKSCPKNHFNCGHQMDINQVNN